MEWNVLLPRRWQNPTSRFGLGDWVSERTFFRSQYRAISSLWQSALCAFWLNDVRDKWCECTNYLQFTTMNKWKGKSTSIYLLEISSTIKFARSTLVTPHPSYAAPLYETLVLRSEAWQWEGKNGVLSRSELIVPRTHHTMKTSFTAESIWTPPLPTPSYAQDYWDRGFAFSTGHHVSVTTKVLV